LRDRLNDFLLQAATVEVLNEEINSAWQAPHRLGETHDVAATDLRGWVSTAKDFICEREI
jgi:hypothetical protein